MEKIIKNAIEMCKYANSKLDGVATENFKFMTDNDFYFRYIVDGSQKGACIECGRSGSNGWSYERIFADKVSEYGGWCGGASIYRFDECDETWTDDSGCHAGEYIFRQDMIRAAMLKWQEIKNAIDAAVSKEYVIDNFCI